MRYLGTGLPATANQTYQNARHDSLNFETCGGERTSSDDASLAPMGQLLYFPARVAERVVVSTSRKEDAMSKHHDEEVSPKDQSTRRGGAENERTETFSPTGPVLAKITTKSGDVRVHTSEGNELEVTLRVSSSRYAELLEIAVVHFDQSTNTLDVRTQPEGFAGSMRSLRSGAKSSWFDFGGSDLDVFVVMPQGSSLNAKTISGDVSLKGVLDDIDVSSISGDVTASDACQHLDVKTTSGDVKASDVRDFLRCRSASGDVTCRGSATKTEISSASGDVTLAAERPGDIVVKVVSGDVHVRVAKGLAVDINGNTVSGDLGTNIDLDATGDARSDEEVITIRVNTVSGDIRIDKAS